MLRRVLLPAPDGPIMAVSSLERSWPLTLLRIVLASETKGIMEISLFSLFHLIIKIVNFNKKH